MKTRTAVLLGGFGGFAGFYLFVFWGIAPPTFDAASIQSVIVLTATTFVGAWAGGAAAFKEEARSRKVKDDKMQISAVNKAIFKISQMHFVLITLRDHYILKDGKQRDEPRPLTINSPQPGMIEDIVFNYDELGFLLDEDGREGSADLVMSLYVLENEFQAVMRTIEFRASAREGLEKAKIERPLANSDTSTLAAFNAVYRQHYRAEYLLLEHLTSQFVQATETALKGAKAMYADFHDVLRKVPLEGRLLKIEFMEGEAKEVKKGE